MTVNLVDRFVLVPSPTQAEAWVPDEPLTYTTGDVSPFTAGAFVTALTISDTRPSISDVQLTVATKADFSTTSRMMKIYLNDTGYEEELATFFKLDGLNCVQLTRAVTIPKDAWNAHFLGTGADAIKFYSTHNTGCVGRFYNITVEYVVANSDERPDNPAALELITPHRTLVTGPNENPGPKEHRGYLAIAPWLGWKLVCVSETEDGELTISYLGAAPGDDNGDRIPTRAWPGTLESMSCGKLAVTWVRWHAKGECAAE
jgi:hypothetical protein